MSQDVFRGVFTIPSTPFQENGEIDWADFKQVFDFCVACGAHGIVWPVNASGFPVWTDEERLQGMQVAVEQTGGRIPVILGVQGLSAQHAAMFSRRAQEVGADGVIARLLMCSSWRIPTRWSPIYRPLTGKWTCPSSSRTTAGAASSPSTRCCAFSMKSSTWNT